MAVDNSKKAVVLVTELKALTEQLVSALERFEVIKAQKNATGFDFTAYNDKYLATAGLEHVDGDCVNSVMTGFEGLIAYLDAAGQYRRDPLNKLRSGSV
jgi:hypothetical protein